MLFVRPARLADLDAIAHMARTAQPVLHSLPHDRQALEARIALSEDSFRADVDFPGEEFYLFVLEDSETGHLLGTASIVAAAGYSEPFYAFRNDALIHASRELHVNRKIHALTMSHELTGRSRLAGFYIDPSLRATAAAHLMSRARMMYIAANRKRFTPEVFSLLLGVTDESGVSPFWEAVGRKFFGRDFREIEVASGGRSRTFIAEVMPSYPLYVPLLPEAAQRVLGEPDEKALLAWEIHLEEGFETDRFVDIFDAGPVLTAQVDRTASVRSNETRVVREDGEASASTAAYLVAHNHADDFRCVLAELPVPVETHSHASRGDACTSRHRGDACTSRHRGDACTSRHRGEANAPLTAAARAALGVQEGDTVRCVRLHRDAEGAEDAQDTQDNDPYPTRDEPMGDAP